MILYDKSKSMIVNFIFKTTMPFFIAFLEIKSLVLNISKTVYHICTPDLRCTEKTALMSHTSGKPVAALFFSIQPYF